MTRPLWWKQEVALMMRDLDLRDIPSISRRTDAGGRQSTPRTAKQRIVADLVGRRVGAV